MGRKVDTLGIVTYLHLVILALGGSFFRCTYLLGMRTRIFCLAPASQCVNSPTEAARVRALLEARLSTNLRARRKLDLLRMTEVDIPKRD